MLNTVKSTLEKKDTVRIELADAHSYDIGKIFDCGQCFRFDGGLDAGTGETVFSGVAKGKFLTLRQKGTALTVEGITPEEFDGEFRSYLAVDDDYDAIRADICRRGGGNPALAEAMSFGNGIRILRQDGWETVVSFIISQNNNIPRIKKLVESLCRTCGQPFESGGQTRYAFPTPEAVERLGVDGLAELKTGFRAKYIYDAARKVLDGTLDLERLYRLDTPSAVAELTKVKGIGPKVASCALLFGFGHTDAFPVDVWIKRVLAKYFPPDFELSSLGEYAGIAQQYLFYYERYR